jgi:hypothetical protein
LSDYWMSSINRITNLIAVFLLLLKLRAQGQRLSLREGI